MKNLKISSALFLSSTMVITSLIISSCSKDRIQQKSSKDYDSQATNNYLDSKKEQEQDFTVDSTGSGPIVGKHGTTISGSKNCLMFPNGDSVAFPFVVKLVELYTPKDMIYWQMPTVASDTILETDGEIRVRAVKNGTDLVLKPGCDFAITMPNAAPKNYMRVFYDKATYDWTDSPASLGITTSVSPIFSTSSNYYAAQVAKLGWINCGFKRGSATNHHLTFSSSTDNLTSVALFIYFPNTKTVMQVRNLISGSIPDGSTVKVIAIAVGVDSKLYSFNKTITVTADNQVDVTMAEITDANLTAFLDGM